jgi:hypothetical protein
VRVDDGVTPGGEATFGGGVGEVLVHFSGLLEDVNSVLSDFSVRYGAFDPWSAVLADARRTAVDVVMNVSDTGVGASPRLMAPSVFLRVAVTTVGVPHIKVRAARVLHVA